VSSSGFRKRRTARLILKHFTGAFYSVPHKINFLEHPNRDKTALNAAMLELLEHKLDNSHRVLHAFTQVFEDCGTV